MVFQIVRRSMSEKPITETLGPIQAQQVLPLPPESSNQLTGEIFIQVISIRTKTVMSEIIKYLSEKVESTPQPSPSLNCSKCGVV